MFRWTEHEEAAMGGATGAVVATAHGSVRGTEHQGIRVFRGMG
jgi:hypothetical protein